MDPVHAPFFITPPSIKVEQSFVPSLERMNRSSKTFLSGGVHDLYCLVQSNTIIPEIRSTEC
jgi:hypothetical protein